MSDMTGTVTDNEKIRFVEVKGLSDLEPLIDFSEDSFLVLLKGKPYKIGGKEIEQTVTSPGGMISPGKLRMNGRLLPVCCSCKKIRDDRGETSPGAVWMTVEEFMSRKAGFHVTSTYCPECAKVAIEALNN